MRQHPFAKLRKGPAMRSYMETRALNLRLVNLPGYSPDFNADEAVWGWARREATGNLCLGTKPWCSTGSTTSSPDCAAGKMR